MKEQKQGKLVTSVNILHTNLNLIKLFSYFLVLLSFVLIGITMRFYSSSYLHSQQNISVPNPTPPPPPPPRSPSLEMNDSELMWRASNMSNIDQTSFKGDPKVAFMFLVKGSIPLAPLWEEFFKGYEGFYSIYVHSDPSFNSSSLEMEHGVFSGRRIPSKKVGWGRFSMVEAEVRLLTTALLEPSNQRFVLLSESCIPLYNFSTVYNYLINSTHHSHIESYDLLGPVGRGRYKHRLSPTIKIHDWRKGSQWFEMGRALAEDVVSDQSYFLLFREACRHGPPCYADEHYLPTWVEMNSKDKNSNRSLTYADWSRGGCHPVRYRRMDITIGFLERLRSGTKLCEYNGKSTHVCFLFARKFQPDALDRLLMFAPKVMHF